MDLASADDANFFAIDYQIRFFGATNLQRCFEHCSGEHQMLCMDHTWTMYGPYMGHVNNDYITTLQGFWGRIKNNVGLIHVLHGINIGLI